MKLKTILVASLLTALGCSDSSDPETLNPEDLSPPLQVVTVTGDAAIELRWQGVNFEDELKGYDVFISDADKSLSDIASTAPAYPVSVDITKNQTIPYCIENHTFFKQFGITAEPSADCEGAKSVPSSLALTQDDATGDGVVKAKVACFNPDTATEAWGDANISLTTGADKAYRKGVGTHRCLITTDRAGAALVNGKTYTFFVVAVTGDDYDGISWTSNFVDDTPAKAIYSGSLTIAAAKYVVINPDTTTINAAVTAGTATSCGTQGLRASICGVWGANAASSDGIYIARDNSSSTYPQRLLISTSSGSSGTISLLHRGDKVRDPIQTEGTVSYRIPEDQAFDKATYSALYKKGSIFIVRDRQVYDILIERTAGTYYGKIAFGDITASKTGNATVPISIVVQSKASTVHYFR